MTAGAGRRLTRGELLTWLREDDHERLKSLWAEADGLRRRQVGEAVWLRGLIEISNRCVRNCTYCGIRAANRKLKRYRMTRAEILACARLAREQGLGTVVLQSGEDPGLSAPWVASVVRAIKAETGLVVTLSLGERDDAAFALWRAAGAERYLLRFETANAELYARLHPGAPALAVRLARLEALRALGYQLGTGFLVGVPGQRYEDLAADLELLADLAPDMIGIGPWLPHPATPLGEAAGAAPPGEQVPGTALMACKALALARLLCPGTNIPSSTALSVADPEAGRSDGLTRGANVVMPNLTPPRYRRFYEIYPAKGLPGPESIEQLARLMRQLGSLERTIGSGPGDPPVYIHRQDASRARSQS